MSLLCYFTTAVTIDITYSTMSGGMIPQRGSSLKTSGIPALTQSLVKDLYGIPCMHCVSKDETTCDLMFLVGVREERVMAHKLIVLARCENYKQKKEEWLSASRMIQVKLGKHSRESVKKVIKYLYTGEVSRSCCYQVEDVVA